MDDLASLDRLPAEQRWRHCLEGFLRRLAGLATADTLVLRGGLLTGMLIAPVRRPTRDLDFLALFECDPDLAWERLHEVLSVPGNDGVHFEVSSLLVQKIWQETAFPGIRAFVQAGVTEPWEEMQIDLGFGDPLEPAADWVDYPHLLGPPSRLLACRAETLIGWKLHGLFEHGLKRWRPKDLHDLLLLTRHARFEPAALPAAIQTAFTSRGEPLASLRILLDQPWWNQPCNCARWDRFRQERAEWNIPADLSAVVTQVAGCLHPALATLGSW